MLEFLTERHLATLTTLRADGSPHVVPVGVTFDPATATARVITSGASAKAGNVRDGRSRVAVCQVDGRRWMTLEGTAVVRDDPAAVADAAAGCPWREPPSSATIPPRWPTPRSATRGATSGRERTRRGSSSRSRSTASWATSDHAAVEREGAGAALPLSD